MNIQWSEKLATHDPRIDDQHRQLFRFAEKLNALADQPEATSQQVDSLIRFLESYIQNHFRYEEACMLKRRCPVAQKNRAEHIAFKAKFDRYLTAYRKSGYTSDWARSLYQELANWLTHHICHTDLRLREFPEK